MNVTYQINQHDRRHRLLKQHPSEQSRSFVKAFLQLMYCQTTNLTQAVIDIDNTSRTVGSAAQAACNVTHPGLSSKEDFSSLTSALTSGSNRTAPFQVFADECGIVVGTSATAVAVADDNLVAIIANGSSAGQFVYYGCYGLNYATGASSASFDIERIFRNSSGGNITVAEIGIYATATNQSSPIDSQVYGFCILRDVLGATVTVNNGEYLKVKYTITVSN